jgi:hypothetical protein
MTSRDDSAVTRVIRRIRSALADLDRNAAVTAEDRLDALYAIQEEITRRILEMERPAEGTEGQPVKWSPVRF